MKSLKLASFAICLALLAAGFLACDAAKPETEGVKNPTAAPASQPASDQTEVPASQPSSAQPTTQQSSAADAPMELPDGAVLVVLPTKGMTCESCEHAIKTTLEKLPGVEEVRASYKDETTTVAYIPGLVNVDKLVENVNVLGYEASKPAD